MAKNKPPQPSKKCEVSIFRLSAVENRTCVEAAGQGGAWRRCLPMKTSSLAYDW